MHDRRAGIGIGRLLRSKSGGSGNGEAPVGEAINKGHQAYSIMLALQLGIRYSVSRVTPEPSFRQLDEYDFQQQVSRKALCGLFILGPLEKEKRQIVLSMCGGP